MFELYESLSLQCKSAPEKIDIVKLKENIDSLDVEGQTYIFALIYYHYKCHSTEVPFKISEIVTVDLQSLPKCLLKILSKFALMHIHRMMETLEMSHAQRLVSDITRA